MGSPIDHALTGSVAIDARLRTGEFGGVEQFIIGLASGLAALDDGSERYLFLVLPGDEAWLRPYLGPASQLLAVGRTSTSRVAARLRRRLSAAVPWLRSAKRAVSRRSADAPDVPLSDGSVEASGADLVHFPMQAAFVTDVPSIYQPWDLQHLHLPEFFEMHVAADRERRYRTFCERAELIVVATAWARDDLARQYGTPRSKIAVIPAPPPIAAYPIPSANEQERIRRTLGLPQRYLFYPAQTWKHKNHLRLLEALAILRDEHGETVNVVCSGRQNEDAPAIIRRARELSLGDQVRFTGFVNPAALQALYRGAVALVFPSLFEGWGFPVVEALWLGVPVACARVTSLPELVGDAAVMFDPHDPHDIADAVRAVWTDGDLRARLARRGASRVRDLNWETTARTYRAHYRALSGRTVTPGDRRLIDLSLATPDVAQAGAGN